MISLPAFRVFVAVAETGGIRGAAERLRRTPSTISMSLKQLEQDVGAALFVGERKSQLTELGKLVLEEGRELLAHYDRSRAAIQAYAGNEIGRAEVACLPSVAITFLPDIIERLARLRPAIHIQVRDMDSRSVQDAVASGLVDLGLATVPDSVSGLAFSPLFSDELALVCRSDSPLVAHQGRLRWSDLEGHCFLDHGSYGLIRDPSFFVLVERASVRVRNVLSLLALVRAGAGITILPRLYKFQSDEKLRFLPLADPNARRVVGVLTRRGRYSSPAPTNFLKVVHDVVRASHKRFSLDISFPPQGEPG